MGINVYFDGIKVIHDESDILLTQDYYPFGMTFNTNGQYGNVKNKFLNNGKELQDDFGLDLYDYGAGFPVW